MLMCVCVLQVTKATCLSVHLTSLNAGARTCVFTWARCVTAFRTAWMDATKAITVWVIILSFPFFPQHTHTYTHIILTSHLFISKWPWDLRVFAPNEPPALSQAAARTRSKTWTRSETELTTIKSPSLIGVRAGTSSSSEIYCSSAPGRWKHSGLDG